MKKLLIFIPTYNESENIKDLLNAVLKLKGNFDILVVDDSSPDGTGEIVKNFAKNNKRIRVIIRKGPKGRGLAAITAYRYFFDSDSDYLCELDADFQEDPNDVFKLMEKAEEENADLVVGSRYVKGGGALKAVRNGLA